MKKTVLVAASAKCADDVSRVLQERFETVAVKDAAALAEQIDTIGKRVAALIVSACIMREDGKTVRQMMKKSGVESIAPVLVCGKRAELESFGDGRGIAAYLEMPFSETLTVKRVEAAVDLYQIRNKAERLIQKGKEDVGANKAELQSGVIDLIFSLVNARSSKCGQHTRCTQQFTKVIAEDIRKNCPQYGLTKEDVEQIALASLVHDIGKITVPDSILFKPDRLSADEYADMRKHTTVGAQLFETTRDLWSDDFASLCHDIILYHHERYDGKGYPFGLKGEKIPISVQIVSLADVYDALSAEREYKHSLSPEEVYGMITRGECGAFSDTMLACLTRTRKELEALIRKD